MTREMSGPNRARVMSGVYNRPCAKANSRPFGIAAAQPRFGEI